MVTIRQIERAIETKYSGYGGEFYDTVENLSWRPAASVRLPGIGEVDYVENGDNHNPDSYGYSDGYAKWVIFKIGDQTFRKNGYYSSYGGTEWDGELHEVSQEVEYIKRKIWREV